MTARLDIAIREKRFPASGKAPPREALGEIRATIAAGEIVALLGPSGCGKTTLLNIIAGLDRDFAGSVALKGSGDAAPRIGYVFQNPRLLPWRTVRENIALVLPGRPDPAAIDALLRAVDLADVGDVHPARLSLGMSRRVAVARAFAIVPDLLILDEPFVSLDEANAERLRRLLLELWRARPATILFVTHDRREAFLLADRIFTLSPSPGRIVGEFAVKLPRERREDPGSLERLQADFARSLSGAGAAPPGAAISGSRDRR